MRTVTLTAIAALALATVLGVLACGEARTGHTPEQVWRNFEKNLVDGNMMAMPGLATKELSRQIMRDKMAFAGLQATIYAAGKDGEIEVLSKSDKAVRMKVTYVGPAHDPWTQEFTVLMEKPGKNWKVSKIDGQVGMNLPGF